MIKIVFSIIFSSALAIALVFLLWTYFFKDDNSFISPLPSFLSLDKNTQVKLLSFWIPKTEGVMVSEDLSTINATSALVYNLTLDKIIYEKEADRRLPMASLTKIMTAIVASENKKEDDRYLVRPENLIGENTMGLSAYEILSLEELQYGLLLPSGNDAAEVLAGSYPGGRNTFIQAMNDKAKSLGLTDTSFSGPSGLEDEGQYTTAQDLLIIAKYLLDYHPDLITVTSTFQHEIPQNEYHKYFFLENLTSLISTYPGVKGIKSGYTDEAEYCLVTYLEYGGHKIVGIVLGSPGAREDMKVLLDYSLLNLGVQPSPHN